MDEAKIATRADISDSDKWDLTHLFADVGKWQEDFAWLQRTYPKLKDWKGRVGESAQALGFVGAAGHTGIVRNASDVPIVIHETLYRIKEFIAAASKASLDGFAEPGGRAAPKPTRRLRRIQHCRRGDRLPFRKQGSAPMAISHELARSGVCRDIFRVPGLNCPGG